MEINFTDRIRRRNGKYIPVLGIAFHKKILEQWFSNGHFFGECFRMLIDWFNNRSLVEIQHLKRFKDAFGGRILRRLPDFFGICVGKFPIDSSGKIHGLNFLYVGKYSFGDCFGLVGDFLV